MTTSPHALSEDQAARILYLVHQRDPDGLTTYLDQIQAGPGWVTQFLVRFAARVIQRLGRSHGAPDGALFSLQTVDDAAPEPWMQAVSALANDDEDTANALMDVVFADQASFPHQFASVAGLVADLMDAQKRMEGAG